MNDKERQPAADDVQSGESAAPDEAGVEEQALAPCEPDVPAEVAAEEEAAEESESELKDQLLRALAETENVRRRARKEVEDASRYGIANFARDMLSVSDNMARALASISDEAREESESVKAIAEGVEMTAREMASALERHGIRQVNPLGEKFDYNLHQAMFEAPGTGQPDGTIVEVVQAGYVIGDRLLRPAMVGVAKGGGESGENGAGGEAQDVGAKVDTSA
jgi:molecular chaperone GrpE